MRIAILGDIHGNLPALDAVMGDIQKAAPDEVWCTGDLAWTGPWASACIERVRSSGWITVKGNADVWVTGDPQTISDEQERRTYEAIAAAHAISEDDARWLLNLPLGHSGPGSILMVHGTPESPFSGPAPDAPPAEFTAYEGHAALVVYGHVHVAFTRRLTDATLVCNTGSVGLPMDGETASYLLIDREGTDFVLRHRRVEFDRDAVIQEARSRNDAAGQRFLQLMGA
jgi:predicted phosphodiesterase